MPIKVSVFSSKLLQAMHNPDVVLAQGNTVGACLDNLVEQYPDIQKLIFDKQHQLRREVYVYVNAESLHKVELTRPVKEKDFLIIAILVSGG
jgi:molybdopterin converting factor small subunit